MTRKKLDPRDLEAIAGRTLDHYNRSAESFWRGTRDHDVSQNVGALLQHIEGAPPFTILDFGCGPGRDLKTFADLGHVAVGLEGSQRFAEMARAYSGCEVWQQDFLKLDLPAGRFDGVFANASLFHVPTQELPQVLDALAATLKPRGVLFSSNPRGEQRGRLEPRPLRRVLGPRHLAALRLRRRLSRARALLPAAGRPAGPAAVARDRVASRVAKCNYQSPFGSRFSTMRANTLAPSASAASLKS